MELGDLPGKADDLEGSSQRSLADELFLGEDREHLKHNTAGAQSGKPIVTERVADTALAPMLTRKQQVVVRVSDRERTSVGHRSQSSVRAGVPRL